MTYTLAMLIAISSWCQSYRTKAICQKEITTCVKEEVLNAHTEERHVLSVFTLDNEKILKCFERPGT